MAEPPSPIVGLSASVLYRKRAHGQSAFDAPSKWSVEYVLTSVRLLPLFEMYLKAAYAEENLIFYQNVINYKQAFFDNVPEDRFEYSAARERALEIVDLFFKRGSKYEINISSLMKQQVFQLLGVQDNPASGFKDSIFEGGDINFPFADSQTAWMQELGISDKELGGFTTPSTFTIGMSSSPNASSDTGFGESSLNLGVSDESFDDNLDVKNKSNISANGIVGKVLSMTQLHEVFDESLMEVTSLIDRNFMVNFQRESNMREWFAASQNSFWPYQGFYTVLNLRRYFLWADLEFEFVRKYVEKKYEMNNALRDPLGKFYKYVRGFQDSVMQEEVQARLPHVGWLCIKLNGIPYLQLKAIDRQLYRLKEKELELNVYIEEYNEKRKLLNINEKTQNAMTGSVRFTTSVEKKMQKCHDSIIGFNEEIVKIKKGVLARGSNVANEQEKKEILALNKKKTTAFLNLQALEDESRADMRDMFYSVESLEFNRLEKLGQVLTSVRFAETKLLTNLKWLAEYLFKDVSRNAIDYNKEAQDFVMRDIITNRNLDAVDPVEGNTNFGMDDFKVLEGLLVEFESVIQSFLKSVPTTMLGFMTAYTLQLQKSNGLLKYANFVRNKAMSEMGNSLYSFLVVLINQMTDNNLDNIMKEKDQQMAVMQQELLNLSIGSASDIAIQRRSYDKYTSELEAYASQMAVYLSVCSSREQDLAKFRAIKKRMKVVSHQLQQTSEGVGRDMIEMFDALEKQAKLLEETLTEQVSARQHLLEMKQQLVRKIIQPRISRATGHMAVLIQKQLIALEYLEKLWNQMVPQVNLLDDMKWLGENYILKDRDNIMKGMEQALNNAYEELPVMSPNTRNGRPAQGPRNNAGSTKSTGIFGGFFKKKQEL